MQWFFIFLIIPVIWIAFAKIRFHTFSWQEAGIQFAISILMCIGLAVATMSSRYTGLQDTEILNGYVQDKRSERVSCSHSYQCNCRTDSKGNRTCSTCYEHSYDINWVVDTTVGSIRIQRVDSQGKREPPRFSAVRIGEPASLESRYTNYIKAIPESIFNVEDFATNTYTFPRYPHVSDYYRTQHVLDDSSGISNSTIAQWDAELKDALKTLGTRKQVNIVVVVTDHSEAYATELEYAWLRGKKNDVVVVLGIHDDHVEWAKSFGWSSLTRVFHEIEDRLTGMNLDDNIIPAITESVEKYYQRESFSQYAYLIEEVSPPAWAVILLFIVNIVITGVIGRHFVLNDGFRGTRIRRSLKTKNFRLNRR